ncbi:MAG: hypothetical protein CML36_06680 [Rhodobacteraceae bacterium]|nr:hypothetical protein [Paracoccaceae bacterium]
MSFSISFKTCTHIIKFFGDLFFPVREPSTSIVKKKSLKDEKLEREYPEIHSDFYLDIFWEDDFDK